MTRQLRRMLAKHTAKIIGNELQRKDCTTVTVPTYGLFRDSGTITSHDRVVKFEARVNRHIAAQGMQALVTKHDSNLNVYATLQ